VEQGRQPALQASYQAALNQYKSTSVNPSLPTALKPGGLPGKHRCRGKELLKLLQNKDYWGSQRCILDIRKFAKGIICEAGTSRSSGPGYGARGILHN